MKKMLILYVTTSGTGHVVHNILDIEITTINLKKNSSIPKMESTLISDGKSLATTSADVVK